MKPLCCHYTVSPNTCTLTTAKPTPMRCKHSLLTVEEYIENWRFQEYIKQKQTLLFLLCQFITISFAILLFMNYFTAKIILFYKLYRMAKIFLVCYLFIGTFYQKFLECMVRIYNTQIINKTKTKQNRGGVSKVRNAASKITSAVFEGQDLTSCLDLSRIFEKDLSHPAPRAIILMNG